MSGIRGDVQGLRAVAVLIVFADHLFGWPVGGFVGVDVFFVISGFLITGILVREFEKTGHISFTGFYKRRIRRILPAAVTTLVVTVALAFALFPRSKASGVLWDAVASFFFVGNWRFAATGTDYFSQGDPSPIQHFWSLGVEEQFYFVWPWLMLGTLILGVRITRRGSDMAIRAAGLLMAAIVVGSFVFALTQSISNPTVAYFSTLTRVWELGAGAVLAIFGSTLTKLPMSARIGMAWGGLSIVAISIFIITPQSAFPAPWAAAPVLGAVLVIAAGVGTEPRGNVVLSNPVFRYIGDISYSLYLWHFPVIILGAAMFPQRGIWYYLGASALGIVIAVLSYELIERPMMSFPGFETFPDKGSRRTAWSRWIDKHRDRVRLTAVAALVPTLVAIVAIVWLFPPQGLTAEQVAQIQQANREQGAGTPTGQAYDATDDINRGVYDALSMLSFPAQTTPSIDSVDVDGRPEEDKLGCDVLESTQCQFGDGSQKILVFGDSLGTTLLPTVRAAFPDSTIRGLTKAACAVTDLDVTWRSDSERDGCLTQRRNVVSYVAEQHPDIVFVIQSYAWAADRLVSKATGDALKSEWAAADKKLADSLTSLGAGRVIFVSAPPQGKSVVDCATSTSPPSACISAVPKYWSTVLAAQYASGYPVLDESDWFCADGRCPVISGTTLIRRDYVHPTRQYAVLIAPGFRARTDVLLAG
ncbi:acyltransferase family protein [Microbacterium sp. NPDC056052]|uniref:acyltransferase family protein n=1 Tax=Microbacterium sp. NPDC056052 TaxID=3345695 RepID=UPI0035DD944E